MSSFSKEKTKGKKENTLAITTESYFCIFCASSLYLGSKLLQCPHQGAYASKSTSLVGSFTISSKFFPTTTVGSSSGWFSGTGSDFTYGSSLLPKNASRCAFNDSPEKRSLPGNLCPFLMSWMTNGFSPYVRISYWSLPVDELITLGSPKSSVSFWFFDLDVTANTNLSLYSLATCSLDKYIYLRFPFQ